MWRLIECHKIHGAPRRADRLTWLVRGRHMPTEASTSHGLAATVESASSMRQAVPHNQPVLRVQPKVRASWFAEMPFLDEHSRKMACNQCRIGTRDDSKTVLTFTLNSFRGSVSV